MLNYEMKKTESFQDISMLKNDVQLTDHKEIYLNSNPQFIGISYYLQHLIEKSKHYKFENAYNSLFEGIIRETPISILICQYDNKSILIHGFNINATKMFGLTLSDLGKTDFCSYMYDQYDVDSLIKQISDYYIGIITINNLLNLKYYLHTTTRDENYYNIQITPIIYNGEQLWSLMTPPLQPKPPTKSILSTTISNSVTRSFSRNVSFSNVTDNDKSILTKNDNIVCLFIQQNNAHLLLKKMTDLSSEGKIIINVLCRVCYCNEIVKKILGFKPKNLISLVDHFRDSNNVVFKLFESDCLIY